MGADLRLVGQVSKELENDGDRSEQREIAIEDEEDVGKGPSAYSPNTVNFRP